MRNDWRHLADQTTRPVLSHVESKYSLYLSSRSVARSCGLDIYVFQLHLMSVNFIIHCDRVSIHSILIGNKGAEYEKRGLLIDLDGAAWSNLPTGLTGTGFHIVRFSTSSISHIIRSDTANKGMQAFQPVTVLGTTSHGNDSDVVAHDHLDDLEDRTVVKNEYYSSSCITEQSSVNGTNEVRIGKQLPESSLAEKRPGAGSVTENNTT